LNHLEIPNLSNFELNELRSTLTILNSKFQKFDKSSNSSSDDPYNPQASTSFSNPQFQPRDYSTMETQSQSQFQFYSDHNQPAQPAQPPQAESSTAGRAENLQQSSSSGLNTDQSL
jgi:hypothetical protein